MDEEKFGMDFKKYLAWIKTQLTWIKKSRHTLNPDHTITQYLYISSGQKPNKSIVTLQHQITFTF